MNSKNRQNLYPTLARTSPVIFAVILVMNCIIQPSFNAFYIFIMYFAIMLSNYALKNLLFKPFYNFFNSSKLTILGSGSRPKGANGCHFTLDDVLSISFGMPSGHSQIAWSVATYILCKIVYNFKNNIYENTNNINNTIKILNYIWFFTSCILIIWVAFYISYSRVYIEGCHTLQQVIVGGLFGIASGFLVYYFEDNIKKILKI
jgi:membrane-associated phospholipid phosphatase